MTHSAARLCQLNLFKNFSLCVEDNGLALGTVADFGTLSSPPKPKLATEQKPCLQPFTRHKLYALLWCRFFHFSSRKFQSEFIYFFVYSHPFNFFVNVLFYGTNYHKQVSQVNYFNSSFVVP